MKMFLALLPVIALSSCAAIRLPDERTVPEPFRGEWNSVRAECGTPDNDSYLVITSDEITFYESAGPVRGAFLYGPYEILIVTNLTGEEETSMTSFTFTLSPDGNSLTHYSESEEPLVRYRCPAIKKTAR